MSRLEAYLVVLGVVLGGCPDTEAHSRAQRDDCNLTSGHLIARAGPSYDAQALLIEPHGGALAAWSNARGTFARLLDSEGAPRAASSRVGERCEGGVALARHDKRRWLGCVRPGQGAYVLALTERGEVRQHHYLGRAGRDSRGIALVARPRGWVAAWHDGTPGAYGVWLAELRGREPSAARLMSNPDFAASAPSLALEQDGDWLLAWSEMRFEADGRSSTRVAIRRAGEPLRSLGETRIHQPDPQLVVNRDDRWLGFRSQQAGDRQSQLYVMRLSRGLKPAGEPLRVGRANTLAPPVLLDCGTHRFASMSRMYGGERFVALHPLDTELKSVGGGYQYYANARDYLGVAAACHARGILLLAAERTAGLGDGARLMAAALRCR